MTEEQFDIVDEQNKVTGKVCSRVDAHTLGLWHRTVHVYYLNYKENVCSVLVHLRSASKDLYPSCWDTRFGGHIKAGESVEQTVVDELAEEIGLSVAASELLAGPIRKRDKYPNREFTHTYFFRGSKSIDGLSFTDREVQEVKWMTIEEIVTSMQHEPRNWSGSPESLVEVIQTFLATVE